MAISEDGARQRRRPRRTGSGARDTRGAAGARGAHELAPYLDTLLMGRMTHLRRGRPPDIAAR